MVNGTNSKAICRCHMNINGIMITCQLMQYFLGHHEQGAQKHQKQGNMLFKSLHQVF